MHEGTITCPSCGHQFELSDALTGQIREHLRGEMQQDILAREKDLKKKLDAFRQQKETLDKERESLDDQVEKKLKLKLTDAEARAAKKAEGKFGEQLRELQDALKERDTSIAEYREKELGLRKKQRELEKARQDAELELARKLDEERGKIQSEAEKKADEKHRLKDLEKDKLICDLKTALEDMTRKAEQGSMETQGEVLELDFEGQLKRFFTHDLIEPVPKGMRGADLVHKVQTPLGIACGMMLWETKNTKAWSAQWIPKLKDDMTEIRATLAILVSVALPEGVNRFAFVDGVWVCDPACAIPLAAALREQLLAVHRERQTAVGKSEKMEMLYHYLAGVEFKHKIEGIVDAFTALQDQLKRERRAMEVQWKEREKQIERVIKNTTGLYGDMQGIIGGAIPRIATLELAGSELPLLPASSSSAVADPLETAQP